MARIEIAAHAGVCFGVQRALDLAARAASDPQTAKPVRTLGPLIHNPRVVEGLAEQGVDAVPTPQDQQSGTLILRAHGVAPAVLETARAQRLNVIDATCPYVKKVHRAAEKLVREGYQLLVLGEQGHPEVEGIVGYAAGQATVIGSASELADLALQPRVGLVVQTTQTEEALRAVVGELVSRVAELRVVNTICSATHERQESAGELAARADVMVVVGGRNSGNTRRLAEICTAAGTPTHHIEDAAELEGPWFEGVQLIGLTAGASTPQDQIDRVVERLHALTDTPAGGVLF